MPGPLWMAETLSSPLLTSQGAGQGSLGQQTGFEQPGSPFFLSPLPKRPHIYILLRQKPINYSVNPPIPSGVVHLTPIMCF